MPSVTAIKPQKNKDFVNLFLDGQFAFSLSLLDLANKKIRVGTQMSLGEVQELSAQATVAKMVNRAVAHLSYRPRSRFEIKNFLQRKFFGKDKSLGETEVTKALKTLADLKLLDDEALARQLWQERSAGSKARGLNFIQAELRRKGINKEIIEELSKQSQSFDWKSTATALVEKRQRIYHKLPREVRRRRLISLLLRRGFDWSLAATVVDGALKDS